MRLYHRNNFVEMVNLKRLEGLGSALPVDVAFFIMQRHREIRISQKAMHEPGTLTVDAHMKVDSMRKPTDRFILRYVQLGHGHGEGGVASPSSTLNR